MSSSYIHTHVNTEVLEWPQLTAANGTRPTAQMPEHQDRTQETKGNLYKAAAFGKKGDLSKAAFNHQVVPNLSPKRYTSVEGSSVVAKIPSSRSPKHIMPIRQVVCWVFDLVIL